MDTKTQRVDVIVVMDELVNYLWNPFEPNNQDEKYKRAVKARSAVAELIEALRKIRDYEGHASTPIRNSVKKSGIARAALDRIGAKP